MSLPLRTATACTCIHGPQPEGRRAMLVIVPGLSIPFSPPRSHTINRCLTGTDPLPVRSPRALGGCLSEPPEASIKYVNVEYGPRVTGSRLDTGKTTWERLSSNLLNARMLYSTLLSTDRNFRSCAMA